MIILIDPATGKLTDDGKTLAAWLKAKYDELSSDPHKVDPSEVLDGAMRGYFVRVLQAQDMSTEEFFTEYPHLSISLWDAYMSDLPDDDPLKAKQSADDAEAKSRKSAADSQKGRDMMKPAAKQESAAPPQSVPLSEARKPSPESVKEPLLASPGGRLTPDGLALFLWIEGSLRVAGLPSTPALHSYLTFLYHAPYSERRAAAAVYFKAFETSELWHLYSAADAASRNACIEAALTSRALDESKLSTPEGQLAEERRLMRLNAPRRFVEMSAGAELKPLTRDETDQLYREATTPDEQERVERLIALVGVVVAPDE